MAQSVERVLEDEQATLDFGAALARALTDGHAIIYLHGDLGAGKTTLSRGVLRGLGHTGAVKSPTYTLVEPYEFSQFPLYHFDLYRLSHPEEVEFLGVENYFDAPAVCLIEWPDKGRGHLPAADLILTLSDLGKTRLLRWQAISPRGRQIADKLTATLA